MADSGAVNTTLVLPANYKPLLTNILMLGMVVSPYFTVSFMYCFKPCNFMSQLLITTAVKAKKDLRALRNFD